MKAKVASMQRGAQKRDNSPKVTSSELYKLSPPLLTDAEVAHFKFGNRSINDFFLGLADILKACHHNHMAAGEVAKVLNVRRAKTACGASWTPRLAWFLMKTWRTVHFAKLKQEKVTRQAAAKDNKNDMATSIGRAVVRNESHAFQKVLRNYFKNPTLGEVFPELADLKRKLTGETSQMQPTPVEPKAPEATEEKRVAKERIPEAIKPQLGQAWGAYLSTLEGQAYLALVLRLQPQLLELAPLQAQTFFGSLRARRTKHPQDKTWTTEEAEQLRAALLLGLHEAKAVTGKLIRK